MLLDGLKKALEEAGLEIYQVLSNEIHIAERIRVHIMDSGVRVVCNSDENTSVRFVVRSQRSDFPNASTDELFERVRNAAGDIAFGRSYEELQTDIRQIKDPVDASKILDVWHEITYEKKISEVSELLSEVRWALSVEKFVAK